MRTGIEGAGGEQRSGTARPLDGRAAEALARAGAVLIFDPLTVAPFGRA